jgi:hypothetical protein
MSGTGVRSPYSFRKLADGTWQRREGDGPWLTLEVKHVRDRSASINAPLVPKCKWRK